MENDNIATQAPTNIQAKNYSSKSLIVMTVVALIIGGIIGFGGSAYSIKSKQPIPIIITVTPTPDPRILTDPYKILKSPVFDEWYGGFTGKVIAKDSSSFTVEQNGARLQIFMQKSISRISDQTVSKSDPPIITLAQLPIGATVQGAVTISIGTLTGNPDQHVIADGIYITSK